VALVALSGLAAVRQGNVGAMASAFQGFKAARQDVDLVYWLDAQGKLQVSAFASR
jgi:hypothetical protein